jgi:two-component system, NtrC family, sensor kinase
MNQAMQSLPTVLVLGALVTVFFAVQRKHRSVRVRLWVLGWCLIFVRFAADLVPTHGVLDQFIGTVQLTGLMLAGFVFLVSVSPVVEHSRPARVLLLQFSVASVTYAALLSWEVKTAWPYVACLTLVFAGSAALIAYAERRAIHAYIVSIGSVVLGTWGILAALRGNPVSGLYLLLFAGYAGAAIVFVRAYRRWTPGTVATCLGMAAWSGVWAVQLLHPHWSTNPAINTELWNVPKYIVAFGMIVLLLEQESSATETARAREQRLKVQVQRFADVTSHLLQGQEVRSFCGEIAQVLVEATTFQRVAILLADDRQQIHLAGYAGIEPSDLKLVQEHVAGLTTKDVENVIAKGRAVGRQAVICRPEHFKETPVSSGLTFAQNPFWNGGDELLVPLRSRSGKLIGLFSLDDPREVERVTAEEMATIEVLGTDLAVAVENAELQRQVVHAEKLAGVGQLVGGIAHELNNPLAVILGYSELLNERGQNDEGLKRGLDAVRRESLRMKQIIASLQHFSRSNKVENAVTDLECALRDACEPRKRELEARGIKVECEIEADLPNIGMTGAQFTQVLNNVISNAVQAIADRAEPRLTFRAKRNGRWAQIDIIDNGPGFNDPQRAFDPFFTTKAPGKGTGLGLSICYGLVRQQGGCISAQNVAPSGAQVTIELPVVEAKQDAAAGAAAGTQAAATTNGV